VSGSALRDAFIAAKQALGFAAFGCVTCGGIRDGSTSIVVVEQGIEPPRCTGCGLMLDEAGLPVGMRLDDGRIRATLIVLEASPEPAGEAEVGGAL